MSNSNEKTGLDKNVINCLPCIYTVHRLNPYKMGFFSEWDITSFNKKIRNY